MSHTLPKQLFAKGELVNIPRVRFDITGKFTAPRGTKELGAGKSYVPPCKLRLENSAPLKLVNKYGLFAAAQALPASFSWNNNGEVRKYKGDSMVGLIMKPLNQLKCGSCWAFSVATSLSDRMAIKQGKNSNLGPFLSTGLFRDGKLRQG